MRVSTECLCLCLCFVVYSAVVTDSFSTYGRIPTETGSLIDTIGRRRLEAAFTALSPKAGVPASDVRSLRKNITTARRRRNLHMSERIVEGGTLGGTEQPGKKRRVLGLGSAGVDFIAQVDRYPTADAKIRTESLEIMGGGNCGNTLVAASRLGLDACLATKVGADANGRLILEGLKEEGVDVSRVIASENTPSAFTYVIVDQEGGTRTCIHTPQTEDTLPQEITAELLHAVSAVHLDSRHTTAAIALARLANERGVPVVVDAEKDRPNFRELLPLADYVVCNRNFPEAFTGRPSREEALCSLLAQGRARLVASTLGADGCIVVTRSEEPPWEGYEDVSVPSRCPMDVSSNHIEITEGDHSDSKASKSEEFLVVRAPSWPVSEDDIVDTTGAGDSFIAAFIYGMTNKMGIGRTLALSSFVAARKLSQPGARKGVPTLEQLTTEWPELLAS